MPVFYSSISFYPFSFDIQIFTSAAINAVFTLEEYIKISGYIIFTHHLKYIYQVVCIGIWTLIKKTAYVNTKISYLKRGEKFTPNQNSFLSMTCVARQQLCKHGPTCNSRLGCVFYVVCITPSAGNGPVNSVSHVTCAFCVVCAMQQ
jgi:hypothetical protein